MYDYKFTLSYWVFFKHVAWKTTNFIIFCQITWVISTIKIFVLSASNFEQIEYFSNAAFRVSRAPDSSNQSGVNLSVEELIDSVPF